MEIEQFSDEEKREIVRYGIERSKVIILSFLVTLTLGYWMGIFFQSLIFCLSFYTLRRYAGGYHAETQGRCYIISLITVLISFCYIKLAECSMTVNIIVQVICLAFIFTLAPVENRTRRLDAAEQKRYRKKTRINIVTIFCICCFFYWKGYLDITVPVMTAYVVLAFFVNSWSNKNYFAR